VSERVRARIPALGPLTVAAVVTLAAAGWADSPAPAQGKAAPLAGFPTALYAELLESHTESVASVVGVRVDYRELRRNPKWKELVAAVENTDPDQLETRNEQLAYWINVYNIFAMKLVASDYPMDSIKDLSGFLWPVWKLEAGTLRGRGYSLDQIEHTILRTMGDPRIHTAIVCASISCPPLRREPYGAERLDAQLDDAARSFLANGRKGARLDRGEGILYLSRIFSWFEVDFELKGGVLSFVAEYLPEVDAGWIRRHRETLEIEYFDYDWRLND
jgi:hypothetical protein